LISNHGRLPTKVRVKKAAMFTDHRLPDGPSLGSAQEDLTVPPGQDTNRIDYDTPAPEGQKGWYYLSGLVEYDTVAAHYRTRFCLEFPWPNTLPDNRAQYCADPKTNYID
jgi:hypothetical protein